MHAGTHSSTPFPNLQHHAIFFQAHRQTCLRVQEQRPLRYCLVTMIHSCCQRHGQWAPPAVSAVRSLYCHHISRAQCQLLQASSKACCGHCGNQSTMEANPVSPSAEQVQPAALITEKAPQSELGLAKLEGAFEFDPATAKSRLCMCLTFQAC